MNTQNLKDFKNCGDFMDVSRKGRSKTGWQDLLIKWGFKGLSLDNLGATYLLALDHTIPRLNGESNILYIGYTGNLGGNDSSRLWNYANKTADQEAHVWDIVSRLDSPTESVKLFTCISPPYDISYKDYDNKLLVDFLEHHWELPPLNFQKGRKGERK